MTDARSRTPQEYMRSTWRRWGRGRRLLVAVIGALVVLAVGAISAAALVGLPTILTGDSNATSPTNNGNATSNTNAGGSQAIPNAQDFAVGASGGATLSAAGQGADPIEGESFTHPTGTEVVLGNQYSGGKALKITSGQALPTKRVTITEASHVLVRARAGQTGGSPTLTIRVDGTNAGTRRITSNVLSDYLYAGITLQPGTYTLGLKGGDLAQGRYVFVDVLRFPAVNEPPVANNDPTSAGDPNYTTLEDAPLTVSAANGVLANDTDPDPGDTITAEKVSGPSHGTLALNPDGSFSYTPNADFNGTDSFTYQAKDSHGSLSTAATVTITVSPVNDAPTDVSLSPSGVEENRVAGTAVGTLSTEDVDAGDTHTYTLVSGAGDDDNGSFQISGNTLHTDTVFDFETKDTYTVRVKTDDGQGGTFDKQLTISITNANDDPTDITLSNNAIAENRLAGTDVGTLSTTDQDAGDSFTYELVSGAGDDDNAQFQISFGTTLQTAERLNFEEGATRSVRVRTSDGHGGTFEEQLTITITDLNDAPTNLALSSDTVEENQPSGTTVGTLSADDEDGDTPTFAFATGSGDADNGSFTIDGNTLKTNEQFDFETKGSYTILVAADDGKGGTTTTKQFDITVTNANDAPTDISLSNSSVAEDVPSGTDVGTLSTTDQDTADTHTYSLVTGAGDTDNGSFQISGSTLQTNAEFDFEAKDSYTVRVQSDDGQGGTTTKQFTITITDANDAPTDISLSDSTVVEHQPSGTPIGTLSTTDQDAGDTFTYSFVTGEGDTDNASFKISGDELQTDADLSVGTYTIRVETDDGQGGTFEKQFEITVVPANFAPTDISLSNNTVAENQPSGTDVGTLTTTDQDAADTHTYTLVAGSGDTDNASFTITGDTLKTGAEFDFETKNSYSIRVRTDDGHPGGTFEESFTITVTNANDAPTDIALSNSSVTENQPSGTDVGTLSTTDQDSADTHTYSLVAGTGDTDNGQFTISGSTLQTNAQFNFEAKNSYSIRVQSDDGHGGTTSKQFTVTVTNANDAPTNLALSNSSVAENQPSGTNVGTLSTTDEDSANTHTYSLVAGDGDTDNASFQISGSTLQTKAAFDFETKNIYTIRLQTSDGQGGTFQKQLTVTVTNANDVPTDIALSKANVDENLPSGTDVGTLSTTDQDSGDTHTYSLVTGTGSTDNGSFTISGGTLKTNAQFNFEAKSSYSVRVRTTDNGTPAQFFEEAFTISINDANDAPVAGTDSYSGVVGNTKASLGVTVTGEPVVALTGNVLTFNDSDEDKILPHTLSAVAETVPSNGGGTATINSDGSFTFVPGVGDKNQPDTFTYKVTDGQATSSGTVTVGITNTLVWYADNSRATNGDGRSSSPFNSLTGVNGAGGAGDADGTGDTLFLFQGSGNYAGGLRLEANQRLIGQAANLTVGSSTLLQGDSTKRPTITNVGADVIDLDDADEVRGLGVDPQGTGGGIAGSSGDTGGGTIDDVRVIDAGTAGTQPGLELDSTTGTFNISNLTVSTNGAAGVRLHNTATPANAVNAVFAPAGQISIQSNGSPGLSVNGTSAVPVNLGTSTFDDITVTGSGTGGVSMSNTSNPGGGTTTFGDGTGTDLSLTTTSGTAPAFGLSNAGTVSVPSSGTANVSATGGPAIDVTGTSGATLGFDDVDSANSGTSGISLSGMGSGTFSANSSSSLSNATNADFNLSGGSGDVTFDGAITDSSGTAVSVASTSGGTKDFNGAIGTSATPAGAINLSGNTGSTVRFDGGTILSTGTSGAFSATGGGTVAVTDPNAVGTEPDNRLTTTTGTALNVSNTTIGANGLTFRSISANGAASGIVLNNTGSTAGLTVTGGGNTAQGGDNSGGTIQSTTSHGISLTNTTSPSFTNVRLLNTGNSGVNGTQVSGFTFTNGTITGAGDASDENSITFDDSLTATPNLTGAVTITNNVISQTEAEGVDIENWAGTISNADISNNALSDTGDVATPGSAITLIGSGLASSAANITKATVANNAITDFRAGVGVQVRAGNPNVGGPTGSAGTAGSATNVIAVTGNSMNGGNGGIGNQPDRFFTGGVSGNGGQGNFNVSGNGTAANRLQHIDCIAIEMQMDGPVNMTSTVQNNFINANSAVGCAGIAVGTDDPNDLGAGTHTTTISGNNVMGTDGPGIFPIVRDSGSTMTAKVLNNTVAAPITTNAARAGIRVDSGSAQGDTTMCLEITGNTTAGSTNSGTGTTSPGINLRKQGPDPLINTFGIEGMAATSSPGVENYVNSLNTSTSGNFGVGGTALLSATQGFTNCTAP